MLLVVDSKHAEAWVKWVTIKYYNHRSCVANQWFICDTMFLIIIHVLYLQNDNLDYA